MVPVVGVDHAPTSTTAFATEAFTLAPTPGPSPQAPISVYVYKELGSASNGRGLETPPTPSQSR